MPGATPSSSASRRTPSRRVQSSDNEDDAASTTTPSARSRRASKSAASHVNDENVDPENENEEEEEEESTPPPPASRSSEPQSSQTITSAKRRKLSKSGRAETTAENEEEEEDNDDDEATPPPGNATATADAENGDANESGEEEEDGDQEQEEDEDQPDAVVPKNEEDEELTKPLKQKKQLLLRDDDGYVMGSIVRIKCHNFLTYTDIECTPGPHLNMIFGPNGSGKSSLVAAIALGLGFPPAVMQRHKGLSDFVKNGEKEGYVEIELKGRPQRKNLVVKRKFTHKDNKSVFELNGKVSTKTAVNEAVEGLQVNITNLCTFLPQDRVSDFAKMTGEQLLKETQRVSDPLLLELQTKLGTLKEKLDDAHQNLEKNQSALVDNERKLAAMDKDVKRYKERKQLEDESLLAEVLLPYAQYTEAKIVFEDAKRERNIAKARIDTLSDQHKPLMLQRSALAELHKQCEVRRKQLVKHRDAIVRKQTSLVTAIAGQEKEIDSLRNDISEIKAAEIKRRELIAKCEADVKRLTKAVEDEPPEADVQDVGRQLAAVKEEMGALLAQIKDIAAKHADLNVEIDKVADLKKVAERDLQSLFDVQRRREEQCKKEDPSLWEATSWTRRNAERFKDKVLDPIRLLVSVKNVAHARIAEAGINYNTMKTVICFNQEDYRMLGDTYTKFTGSNGQVKDLRVNVAELPPDVRSLDNYPRPMSNEELRNWGFDAFVIDLLDGPPGVLAYLCFANKLHMVPVAFDNGQRIPHERLKQPNSPFRRYITQSLVTDISFSRYGQRKATVQDNPTKEARLFHQSIDQNRKREIEQRIADIEATRTDLQTQRDTLMQEDPVLREQYEPIAARKAELENIRKGLQKAREQFERNKVHLRQAQTDLRKQQNKPSADAQRAKLSQKLLKTCRERTQTAQRLEPLAGLLIRGHEAEAMSALMALQTMATINAIGTSITHQNEEMNQEQAVYAAANTRHAEAKILAKKYYEQASAARAKVPDRLEGAFDEQVSNQKSAEAYAQQVADLRGQLEMSANISPSVIKRAEDLTSTVERLRATVEEQRDSTRSTKARITKLHDKWYPRVKEIVQAVDDNFSKAMQSLGCLGEVSIFEHEEYAKWAIVIKVAFRDGEQLAELTAHRQSGGERSLSTMLYLISLLELSKVPFSLVDEINQGMDARAERAVHNHLVSAVCDKPDVGQYFLLTPKLLTNLNYHKNIKILCVNNGDWLPDKLPLRDHVRKILAAKTASGSGAGNRQ